MRSGRAPSTFSTSHSPQTNYQSSCKIILPHGSRSYARLHAVAHGNDYEARGNREARKAKAAILSSCRAPMVFSVGLWGLMFWAAFRIAPTEIHWNDIYLSWVEKGGPRLVVPHAIAFFILPIAILLFVVYRKFHAFEKSRTRPLYWLYLTIAALTCLLLSLLCWYLIFRRSFGSHFASHHFYYNALRQPRRRLDQGNPPPSRRITREREKDGPAVGQQKTSSLPANGRPRAAGPAKKRYTSHEVTASRVGSPSGRTTTSVTTSGATRHLGFPAPRKVPPSWCRP
jgi:hypothetical protein